MANEHLCVKTGFVPLLNGVNLVPKVTYPNGTYDAKGNSLKSWEQLVSDGDIILTPYGPPSRNLYTLATPSDRVARFSGVKKIVLPDWTIVGIDSSSFEKCSDLEEFYFGKVESVYQTNIGERAFRECTNLRNVQFASDNSYYIESTAFGMCAMKSINMPGSSVLTGYIGTWAFVYCDQLETATIGSSFEIHELSFDECPNLKTIYYSGTSAGAPWGAVNATVISV